MTGMWHGFLHVIGSHVFFLNISSMVISVFKCLVDINFHSSLSLKLLEPICSAFQFHFNLLARLANLCTASISLYWSPSLLVWTFTRYIFTLTSLTILYNFIQNSLDHISLPLVSQSFIFHFPDHMAIHTIGYMPWVGAQCSTFCFSLWLCPASSMTATASSCCTDLAFPCFVITLPLPAL